MNFIVTTLLGLLAISAPVKNTPIDSIPFVVEKDNRIYTYLKVNNTDSLYFLIDTGASDMVINANHLSKVNMEFDAKAANMGAAGQSEVALSTNNRVVWGQHETQPLEFIAIPFPGAKWDGVLGLSLMKQFVVEINYSDKRIYLYDKRSYNNPSANRLKISYAHGVPVVPVSVKTADEKTRELRLELDTGSDRVLDLNTSYVNQHNLLAIYPRPFAKSTVSGSDGNTGTILEDYFTQVNLSNFELYRIPGGLAQIPFGIMNSTEIDGVLGNLLLKRFNLIFDFERNYLYLTPNNYIHSPFYSFLLD